MKMETAADAKSQWCARVWYDFLRGLMKKNLQKGVLNACPVGPWKMPSSSWWYPAGDLWTSVEEGQLLDFGACEQIPFRSPQSVIRYAFRQRNLQALKHIRLKCDRS